MSGIKVLKADDILRPVYKKTIFRNIEWLLPFWTFLFTKSAHRPYYEMKTFFIWLGWMVYQKIRFSCWFQKCTYDLSKKCTQKKFCPKNRFSIGKIVFWIKRFLGALFTKVIMYIFEISTKIFDAPFDLFKEKNF